MRIKTIVDKRKPYVGMVFYYQDPSRKWEERTIKRIERNQIYTKEKGAFSSMETWDRLVHVENRIRLNKPD